MTDEVQMVRLEDVIETIEKVCNFGDYAREELTADFGQPRFDMAHEILRAVFAMPTVTPEIVAPAECGCDDPNCGFNHEPLTLRQAYENCLERLRQHTGVLDHKWLDPRCGQTGCRSLILINALRRLKVTSAIIDDEIAEFGKPMSGETYAAWNAAIDEASGLVADYGPTAINCDQHPDQTSPMTVGPEVFLSQE